ncbi:hypothetical protein NJBCHELONAE_23200 [Mycobacteroides chelonae]|nr:hypothetical protein NJBCHELONAE_23200 [Mycobacteroides chelonae]
MARSDRLARRRQGHIDTLRDQYGGITFGAQCLQPDVVRLLGLGAYSVDKLSGLSPLLLWQRAQRLPRERQRRLLPQMVNLCLREGIQVTGAIKGRASSINGARQSSL